MAGFQFQGLRTPEADTALSCWSVVVIPLVPWLHGSLIFGNRHLPFLSVLSRQAWLGVHLSLNTEKPVLCLGLRVQGWPRSLRRLFGKGLGKAVFSRQLQGLQVLWHQTCEPFPRPLCLAEAACSSRSQADLHFPMRTWSQQSVRDPCAYLDPHQDRRGHCQPVLVNVNSTLSPTRRTRQSAGQGLGRGPGGERPRIPPVEGEMPLPQPRWEL